MAAVLTAAYGLGGLAGSLGVMARPLTGSPDRLQPRLAVVVAAGLMAAAVSPTFGSAVAAYALTGVVNAYFFAATLAARTEYAPPEARGQVFIWVAALKITSASAGTALAGALAGANARLPLFLALGAVTAAVTSAALESRGEAKQRPRGGSSRAARPFAAAPTITNLGGVSETITPWRLR
ncbi:hypothetical protein [Streptomyces sp. NPDC005760]|uniref:hypothetical protein n=1 Tax=Streptomyces sp. NPDC005760 TaxID=3156718 RepID=UPI0033FD3D9C